MTEEQRQQIKVLRYKGFGYEKIAKSIGLSRDSVRCYCVRNGLKDWQQSWLQNITI